MTTPKEFHWLQALALVNSSAAADAKPSIPPKKPARRYLWFIIGVMLSCLSCMAFEPLSLKLDAARARIHTVGSTEENGWNLFSNGELGDYLLFPTAGSYRVKVQAWGSPCQGTWPEMALLVDGERVQTTTVSSLQPRDYTFQMNVAAGTHTVTVGFINDAVANGEDRNLYIARVEVSAPAGSPKPSLASPQKVAAEARQSEERILSESDAAIERNRKGDAVVRVVDASGHPVSGAKVVVEQTRHDFLFGCNIYAFDRFKTDAQNEEYKRRFVELFNYATTGFYWQSYEPEPGKPQYAYTDKVIAWCAEYGIRLKGHPLLWAHEAGIPVWSQRQPSPEKQRERVLEIMRRYQGKIEFWEVVNEPSHLPGLKIDAPYHWAREADSKAHLIVNDNYVMADGQPPFYRLLEDAIRAGVPFDGIGIQAHEPRTMRFPLERVHRVLDKYAALGKALHITEFTPTSSGQPMIGSPLAGVWDEASQADYAVKFYRVCFAHPAVAAITWWDLCDAHSWLKGGGMLRSDLTPKRVYDSLKKLIQEQWHTRIEGATDGTGRLSVRGFFGQYVVHVQEGSRKASGAFHVSKDDPNETVVYLPASSADSIP